MSIHRNRFDHLRHWFSSVTRCLLHRLAQRQTRWLLVCGLSTLSLHSRPHRQLLAYSRFQRLDCLRIRQLPRAVRLHRWRLQLPPVLLHRKWWCRQFLLSHGWYSGIHLLYRKEARQSKSCQLHHWLLFEVQFLLHWLTRSQILLLSNHDQSVLSQHSKRHYRLLAYSHFQRLDCLHRLLSQSTGCLLQWRSQLPLVPCQYRWWLDRCRLFPESYSGTRQARCKWWRQRQLDRCLHWFSFESQNQFHPLTQM